MNRTVSSTIAGLAELGGPVVDAPVELDGGLTRHVAGRCRVREAERIRVEDLELLEPRRVAECLRDPLPAEHERLGACDRLPARHGIAEARQDLRVLREAGLGRRLRFRDEDPDVRARGEEIQDAGAAIPGDRRSRVRRRVDLEHLAHRQDVSPVQRLRRALRGRVEPPDLLDGVADELDADRLRVARREEVHDAAATRELAVLIDRVLGNVAGVGEHRREIARRQLVARLQHERRLEQALRRAHAGQQRRGGRHDQARRAAGERVQGPGPGRGHVEVRRQAPIGVDFRGRERQHGVLHVGPGQSLQCAQEEPGVVHHRLDVAVGGNHEEGGAVGAGRGDGEGLGGTRETGKDGGAVEQTCPLGGGLEQGPQGQRRRGSARQHAGAGGQPRTFDPTIGCRSSVVGACRFSVVGSRSSVLGRSSVIGYRSSVIGARSKRLNPLQVLGLPCRGNRVGPRQNRKKP